MRNVKVFSGTLAVVWLGLVGIAQADPLLRTQVDQRGDFLLIGNTMGHECRTGTPDPTVGTIGNACSSQSQNQRNDSSPDAFWNGSTLLGSSGRLADAKTTARLNVPAGATVTHAYLYWAATRNAQNAPPDAEVTLRFDGGAASTITAIQSWTATANTRAYQSVADVTALVQANGSGAYQVSGITADEFYGVDQEVLFGGWSMVVFYRLDSAPPRNLALFDGLDPVSNGNPAKVQLSGFLVPNAGFDGKLGIVAYEGDNSASGDRLFFHPTSTTPADNLALSHGPDSQNNFFSGSRTWLGSAITVAGDLPQTTGAPQSFVGLDHHVVDVTGKLSAGQTSTYATATSSGDIYLAGVWVTSISTYRPEFSSSTKTVTDDDAGAVLVGDTLTYTITAKNTGNDPAIGTVLTDALPAGVTYVAGSIEVDGVGKTDAKDTDVADYDAATRTVTVRLGAGASGTAGGTMAIGASSTVSFKVTIDAGASGKLENQANITASGQQGAPETSTPTDGNGPDTGTPPTSVDIDECTTSADCASGLCDTSAHPYLCVECATDDDCGGKNSGQLCDQATSQCVDGCTGEPDKGCPGSKLCTSSDATVGQCVGCITNDDCGGKDSGWLCSAGSRECESGCTANPDEGCPGSMTCTSTDGTVGVCEGCVTDSDCGATDSGHVCDAATTRCIDGCRGEGGNGCPSSEHCTSTDATIGSCEAGAGGTGGAGGTSGTGGSGNAAGTGGSAGAGATDASNYAAEGNGLLCAARPMPASDASGKAWLLGLLGVAGLVVRRRRAR